MADYRINVIIDPRTRPGALAVERDLTRLERRADGVTAALRRMLGILGGAAILRQTITTLATFEQTMSTVKAISGATAAEFDQLRTKVKDLGLSTRFSATEAAGAILELSKAGFTVAQSLETVNASLLLAQAGGVELARGTEITVNALTAFQLSTDQAGRVVDVLTKAANDSVTDVSELGEAMKFAGPVAAALGISLEETVGALETLAQAGLKASLGGTGLRIVMSSLEAPTKEVRKTLEEFGITADEVKISEVGLSAAMKRLADAGVDAGAAFDLFGQRGSTASIVLQANLGKMKTFTEGLRNAGGTAKEVAAIMDDNLNGSLLKMKASFQGLLIELGEQGLTGGFSTMITSITRGFHYLVANADTVVRVVTVLVELLAVRLAVYAIGKVLLAFRALGVAMLTNPLGLLAKGLVLTIALLTAFGDQMTITAESSTTVLDVLRASWEAITTAMTQFADLVTTALGPAFASMNGFVDEGNTSFKSLVMLAALTADSVLDTFIGMYRALVVIFNFESLAGALFGSLISLTNSFIQFINTALASLGALIKATVQTMADAAGSIIQKLVIWGKIAALNVKQALTGFTSADIAMEIEDLQSDLIELGKGAKTFAERFTETFDDLTSRPLIPELKNPFTEEMKDLGIAVAEAFKSGFNETNITGFVEGIFKRADEIAAERKAKADAAAKAAAAAPAGAGVPGGVPAAQIEAEIGPIERRNKVLQDYLLKLAQEKQLLGMSWREREVANEIMQLENDLRAEGIKLTDAQRSQIKLELEKLQILRLQDETLKEIKGPMEDIRLKQEALNSLFQSGKITLDEYNRSMRQLGEAAKQSQLGLGGIADITVEILEPAFRHLEDAFVDFATTGEFSFSQLVDSMLKDIARLLIQQGLKLLLGLLTGGAGGLGGLVTGIVGGALGGGGGGGGLDLGGGGGGGGGGALDLGGGGGGLGIDLGGADCGPTG